MRFIESIPRYGAGSKRISDPTWLVAALIALAVLALATVPSTTTVPSGKSDHP
ncbi:hypothetical protein RBSWK_05320 [Rhodopirellula baltica SWK14]|uniref:Uncharacterized protein n=1 Tax=Rhodopirellula baltica SWK14 TaxID=993516 RepID=L7C9A2_RHOBT|nr:hypothetical protein RBSWK_05320 [Rhodopirellula baltica SWK14]